MGVKFHIFEDRNKEGVELVRSECDNNFHCVTIISI